MINKFERMQSQMENLQELMEKYHEYRMVQVSEVAFHPPINAEQKKMAERVKLKNNLLAIFFILASLFFFVLTIVKGMGLIAVLSVAFFACIMIGISAFVLATPLLVVTGKAIYKDFEKSHDSTTRRRYYLTVIPDGEEKVLFRRVSVSKADYEKIGEGTPVLVVKLAGGAAACIL